ncbi:MAG: acyloxyacyl hydrolase [Proteobacteria bacterium]|nr:acyloxyacyl hydrolase [Pseudomonadota bacterium]
MQPPAVPNPQQLCALAACLLGMLAPACAQDRAHAPSLYLQGSWASHDTDAFTIGATLPFGSWSTPLWGGELRAHWDLYLSRWSFDGIAGYNSSLVLGVTPTLRLRPNQGRAAWFWEAGLGATLANHRYRTAQRTFSTQFNFAPHLGLGINLGAQRQHEWLLSVQHVSNAGIKEPNPGLNFVRLRYALHF